jgi:GTP-binding protein HflX
VTSADIILHVRDIANPDSAMQKAQVLSVLADLGVTDGEEGEESNVPIVEIWNKWDQLDAERREELAGLAASDPDILPLSAQTGFGVNALVELLGERLTGDAKLHALTIPSSNGQRIAWLYAHGEVLADEEGDESEGEPTRQLKVRLTEREYGRYLTLGD